MDKQVKKTKNNLPGPGPGRPKGAPNKTTAEVKQMIIDALNGAGGVNYLMEQAKEKPAAFLALVGKVMPLQVNGAGPNGEHVIQSIQVNLVKADAAKG